MFEHLDRTARDVLAAAHDEAVKLGDNAVGTEHLALALATSRTAAADLLTAAGCDADRLRATMSPRDTRHDHASLLADLGIDLAAVRARAEGTFGADAIRRAAATARPGPRRSLWSRISCSAPRPVLRCDSPLAGRQLGLIPRVKRLLHRAVQDARPAPVGPSRLLLALLENNEPACERMAMLGVDLDELAVRTRRAVSLDEAANRRAG